MNISMRNNLVQSRQFFPPSKPHKNNSLQFGVCPICITGGAIAGGGLLIGLISRLKKSVQSKKIAASPEPLPESLKIEKESQKKSSDVSGTKPMLPEKDACCL
jgi:hypothetical protein